MSLVLGRKPRAVLVAVFLGLVVATLLICRVKISYAALQASEVRRRCCPEMIDHSTAGG